MVPSSILFKSNLVISIRIEALYPNYWRYIRTILRFIKEEAEVRKQEFFMKTSYAYFENCAFWALDIAPTLDVRVLLLLICIAIKCFMKSLVWSWLLCLGWGVSFGGV